MNDTQLSRVFAPFVVAAAVVIFVVAAVVSFRLEISFKVCFSF